MYGSQFDGAAAFSGGGFMPSQATQSADPSFSTAPKSRDAQSLLPLTVKQINEATLLNDNFMIDGVTANNVTLVGMVFNKAERVTDVTFLLDDGTGRLECHKWISEGVDSREVENIMDGMYVRVHGHLKAFQGKRSLNVFSIRPVTDFNEIANHFIECIYVHLYNTKLQQQMTATMSATPSKGYQSVPPNQFSGQYNVNGGRDSFQMVLNILQDPQFINLEKGLHVDFMAQQLKLPKDKITEVIKVLTDEGLIYSTIDDYHYRSTANG